MARSILVPLDGSDFAEQALPYALLLTDAADAVLHVLTVAEPLELSDAATAQLQSQWQTQVRERDAAYLHEVAGRLRETGRTVEVALVEGTAGSAIAHYARRHDIDIIVSTTHARGGLERVWIGSVASTVIREAGVPVLLIRPGETPRDVYIAAPRWQRILLAWDGSEEAGAALDITAALAAEQRAELVLAHSVTPYAGPTSPYLPHAAQIDRDMLESRQAAAERDIAEAAARARRYVPALAAVSTVVETHAAPARGVLAMAAVQGADLIATGTHGRGGLRRALLGSVADKIVRGAEVPVLVCRQRRPDAGQ